MAFVEGESTQAAEAAECAADQGEDQYWQYFDRLYENQLSTNRVEFNYDNLKLFAADIGLDSQTFNECLDAGKYNSLVQSQKQAGFSLGVDSTPTFFINGTILKGNQTFEAMRVVIEAARGQ
jgi:protein-disulfide isomerase